MPTYQIFYARRPTFHISGDFGTPRLTVFSLGSSHARLCEVEADSLDEAWRQMQAEYWSPNGEARPLLERLGLSHTSMSVGDVIRDELPKRSDKARRRPHSGPTLQREADLVRDRASIRVEIIENLHVIGYETDRNQHGGADALGAELTQAFAYVGLEP